MKRTRSSEPDGQSNGPTSKAEAATVASLEAARTTEGRRFYEEKLAALKKEKKALKDGTHQEMLERQKELGITRDRELKDAALYRELRIREIEAMYKYDCKAAKETYLHASNEIKENLLSEINDTIKRMEDLRDGNSEGEVRSSSRKLRSKRPENAGEDDKDEVPDSYGINNTGNESTKSIPNAGYGSEMLSGVNFFMREDDVREDLRKIQLDWKTRAEKFISENEIQEEAVKISDGVLYYNELILEKDAEVVCTSEMTKEELYGTLQSIKPNEVIVKLQDGTQARLLLKHLRNGRCTIALQEEYQ